MRQIQLLLNSQARTITGLLRSIPRAFLQKATGLPSAQDLLDHCQTKFAVRALNTEGDYPACQLLPANFRFGELYRHEGATGQPSSVGWVRPEKTHRSCGRRHVQQIVRHVSYDTEYGFQLPCRADSLTAIPVIRTHGCLNIHQRIQSDDSHQLTLFVSTNK
jgi:hypothetical protein